MSINEDTNTSGLYVESGGCSDSRAPSCRVHIRAVKHESPAFILIQIRKFSPMCQSCCIKLNAKTIHSA